MSAVQGTRRVVVTPRHFDWDTTAYLESRGCQVHVAELATGQADGALPRRDLLALLDGADGWIVGHARVDGELLQALPRLKVVARRGVGYERIDTAAVASLGRVATIAAGGNDASVADHTVAMMLAVLHRLRESQLRMQRGEWDILVGAELYRKNVGIVGLGRIGRTLVQRLRGFEVQVLATSPNWDEAFAREHGIRRMPLEDLLAASDIVSLHVPLSPSTSRLIDARALARMKPSAILINTSRGGVVDDAALLKALRAGELAGAGLDVFSSESNEEDQAVTNALIAMPHVVATPHSGASTREGLVRTNRIAAECIVAVLDGRTPPAGCVVADGRPLTRASA